MPGGGGEGGGRALQFTGHHHCHHHHQRQTDHRHNDQLDIIKIDIEVKEYWSAKQRDNFARFCHPMRTGARVQRREVKLKQLTSLDTVILL